MPARTTSLVVLCLPALALAGAPAAVAPPRPAATAAPTAASTAQLGKIDVRGVKPLVETLQEVKVAVKRPFDNDPAHFDDMVCRLGGDDMSARTSDTLECGTQGWFGMRRNEYLFGNFGMPGGVAVSTLGHPWHSIRALTPHQMMVLRQLLKELPPPGQGDVQVLSEPTAAPSH